MSYSREIIAQKFSPGKTFVKPRRLNHYLSSMSRFFPGLPAGRQEKHWGCPRTPAPPAEKNTQKYFLSAHPEGVMLLYRRIAKPKPVKNITSSYPISPSSAPSF